jgi:hypothetical protein
LTLSLNEHFFSRLDFTLFLFRIIFDLLTGDFFFGIDSLEVNLFSFCSNFKLEANEDIPAFFMFGISEPLFYFESFGSGIGVGAFAESSVLIYLRDLFTSIIYFALNGSSDSSGASGLD